MSMVQRLDTIQMGWNQIVQMGIATGTYNESKEPDLDHEEDETEFLQRLEPSLEVGTLIIEAFEKALLPYKDVEHLSISQASKTIWNQTALKNHQERLSHQAVAMTCLMQLKSALDRKCEAAGDRSSLTAIR